MVTIIMCPRKKAGDLRSFIGITGHRSSREIAKGKFQGSLRWKAGSVLVWRPPAKALLPGSPLGKCLPGCKPAICKCLSQASHKFQRFLYQPKHSISSLQLHVSSEKYPRSQVIYHLGQVVGKSRRWKEKLLDPAAIRLLKQRGIQA